MRIKNKKIDEFFKKLPVSKNYETILLGNNYRINEKFSINSSLSFNNVNYTDMNTLFDTNRKDDIFNVLFGLGYSYSKDLGLGLTYNYVNQNSNQTPSDYDKNSIKSSLYYTF